MAWWFQKRNGIFLKTVRAGSGDVNLQVADENKIVINDKRKNLINIFMADEKCLFYRCILEKTLAFKK